MTALQDRYPDDFSHCYGCGRLNATGPSLHVDFLKPTPLGPELVLRARPTEVGARKVLVEMTVYAGEAECARVKVVAVPAPASMRPSR